AEADLPQRRQDQGVGQQGVLRQRPARRRQGGGQIRDPRRGCARRHRTAERDLRQMIKRPARKKAVRATAKAGARIDPRIGAAKIATRVDSLAGEIAAALPSNVLIVSVLKGSFVFVADLIRALSKNGRDWPM